MNNIKIRIKDEEHSRRVQEVLFGMGHMWNTCGRFKHPVRMNYIYAYSDTKLLAWSDDSVRFDSSEVKEVFLCEWTNQLMTLEMSNETLSTVQGMIVKTAPLRNMSEVIGDIEILKRKLSILYEELREVEAQQGLLEEAGI